ncbi:thioredoxin reductase [Streptomyces sp. Ag109_G2-6]|uniref:NAD(P)/FAD-dependent oxidoreductase n=1 Tax=Streptomyces sp. Ag109_G2-6 TaxID=2485154 RepID=UPI000F4FFAE2|nr:FAD-dependent oxidoreductase [Streptomyces sp. Ag109_G2-6]RPF44762.1 thioredoxin reductase [Streptomyces sp. Ag109_G2-6]
MNRTDPTGRTDRTVDVLVVGAGPAGLALATRAARAGAGRVEVLEREEEPGGAPRHCHHGGFGSPPLPWVTGPAYARRAVAAALDAGAALRTGVTATGWAGPLTLETTSPSGLERITARAVVLATGARERPRSARLVPGTRPAGVFTTGELQRSLHPHGHHPIGRRAVLIGAEPVARHAARTLRRTGTQVVAMLTQHPRATALPGIPLLTRTTVSELHGRGRLTGVAVRHEDGRSGVIACDTVVFTGDWIPEHDLARRGGIALAPGTRGPAVDAAFRTGTPGVFAVGNTLHGIESAATAAAEGAAAATPLLAHLSGTPWPTPGPPLLVQPPLAWATPTHLTTPATRPLLVRTAEPLTAPKLQLHQNTRLLWHHRPPTPLTPTRSLRLPPHWTPRVDPDGGPVILSITDRV